jgi:hypothetical protein
LYPYAFDNGKGTTMEELLKGAPQSPTPAPADLASFSALQSWFRRIRGFTVPEAEFRQTWNFAPDARLGV